VRGHGGYVGGKHGDAIPRLNVLDLQKEIRSCPKPVVAMVAGLGDRRRAGPAPGVRHHGGRRQCQVRPDRTEGRQLFDGGFGASYLARCIGQKKAREFWYTCRQYDAQQALAMGLVNEVVPLATLERRTLGMCQEMLRHSPLALRCLKSAFNADCDGQVGLQELAGNATLLFYMSEEGREGHRRSSRSANRTSASSRGCRKGQRGVVAMTSAAPAIIAAASARSPQVKR